MKIDTRTIKKKKKRQGWVSSVETNILNAWELRLSQEQVHVHKLAINLRPKVRGFMALVEQQACRQQGQNKTVALQ